MSGDATAVAKMIQFAKPDVYVRVSGPIGAGLCRGNLFPGFGYHILRMLHRLNFILLVLALASCNRAPAPTTVAALPAKPVAEIHSITQLPPNRNVHVAVDSLGNIFYTIESDSGHDGAIVVGDTGIPRATQLTSENILAAMGETVGGNGTIQDLSPGPDGTIFFYFIGGKGKVLRACIGQYSLRGQYIRILFDTPQLTEKSEMGESIALARGSILPIGSQVCLFLRHSDSAVLLTFDARGMVAPALNLTRVPTAVHTQEQPIDLTRDQYDLFSPGDGSLLLLDRLTTQFWTINLATGVATPRISLIGLPREMSAPISTQPKQLTMFVADSEPNEADMSDIPNPNLPKTIYPALLQINGTELSAIGRDDLHAYGGFPTYAIRIHEMVIAPDGSLIAYDLSSGLLMRLRITTE